MSINLNAFDRGAYNVKQFAGASRLALLALLLEEPRNVGALTEALGSTQPNVSHHLSLLRHSGLVEPTRNGKEIVYAISDVKRVRAFMSIAFPDGIPSTAPEKPKRTAPAPTVKAKPKKKTPRAVKENVPAPVEA